MEIKIIGIGGGGIQALNHMIDAGLQDVDFVAVDTGEHELKKSRAATKIQIYDFAGLDRIVVETEEDFGKEAKDKLIEIIDDTDQVFLVTGVGGGTGSGAAPVIAAWAQKAGALTVGIVTTPFRFESRIRHDRAKRGLTCLKSKADILLAVSSDKVDEALNKQRKSLIDTWNQIDDVVSQAVQSVINLTAKPGLIGTDFKDVKNIVSYIAKVVDQNIVTVSAASMDGTRHR